MGGATDTIIMRIVDIISAFPFMVLVIAIIAMLGPGLSSMYVALTLVVWRSYARIVRGEILVLKKSEYVVAARSLGFGRQRIMFRHILPNIIGPLVVAETLAIPGYISTEAFLSFIGLGVNPPTPSWGSMISDGSRAIRTYPNQAIFPALALAVTMFAFNFLGDGLRDALDPRMRGTQ
jgi:oligopeptide transport system permease protein